MKKENKQVYVVAALVAAIVVLAAYAALSRDGLTVQLEQVLLPPSAAHPFGTDHLGRDVLARLAEGGFYTVGFSVMALAVAVAAGVPFGMMSGWFGGKVDRVFMRIADSFLAFPDTIIAIVLSGLMGAGLTNLVLAIVLVKWVNYARLARSIVWSEKQKEYIVYARISGRSSRQMMRIHLWPHVAGQVAVLASLDLGKIILLISSLSYIGLGAQPPAPEWGAMLNEARPYFQSAPAFMLYPGLAIMVTVLLANGVGDWLRRRLDVRR